MPQKVRKMLINKHLYTTNSAECGNYLCSQPLRAMNNPRAKQIHDWFHMPLSSLKYVHSREVVVIKPNNVQLLS